jgi:acetolactate synthase-1/2/3 large subunit
MGEPGVVHSASPQGAGAPVAGSQLAIDALAREGISHVFGLPGTTVMHLIDALARQDDIRYIAVRHEQVAAFMADGFARASGEVGVCLASRGPGAANLAIGIHNAHAESVPVVALVGQVADEIVERHAFEEMDLKAFFEPMTKWAVEVHITGRVPELTQRAVRVAAGGRPGPVLLSLPLDVQIAKVDEPRPPSVMRHHRPVPTADRIEEAVELLGRAERPVIIAGGGMLGDDHDRGLIELAETLNIPVVATWLRKTAFPNDHDLFAGALGYGAPPTTDALVGEADVILALGCRFSEFSTKRWTAISPEVALIHVDVDAEELGRNYVPALALQGGASETVALMAEAARARERDRVNLARALRASEIRARVIAECALPEETATSGVGSSSIVAALADVLPRHDATLVHDVHTFGPWVHRYLHFDRPGSFFGAAGGSMGWGLPAAMGIQLARPGQRIVALLGDGSFWMVAQDLETAVREDIPVVCVITNNFSYGNTRDRQRFAHEGRYNGVFYGNPDFAEFARLLGAHGERVEDPAELVPALERSLASGLPSVVDVIQDRFEGLPPGLVPPTAK